MTNNISLSCPTCGDKLKITNNMNNFACGHCGSEHIVKREGGVITLVTPDENKKVINDGVDKTESKLAIPRLEREIKQFEIELSEIRAKFTTEDCLKIATGFSIYNSFLIGFMRAIENKYLSIITGMGIGIGAFLVALIGMFFITERMEVKPKKEIEKRKQEIEKHERVLAL